MSGGVDSAVAAARAVDAGHDVTGVHLALSTSPATLRTGARGCCTVEDSHDARRAADVLGIPFYIWNLAERFRADVIDDFVDEYAAGRTPNPCLRCNEKIKFSAVLDKALALGFDAVVTGHHARLIGGRLRRSVDEAKDQSYVLAVCTDAQLAHAMFPLGDSTKTEVRAEAAHRGLAVADKPDSHDICFIADGDTRGFLEKRLGHHEGPIVDASTGDVLGSHGGSFGFTVGQRRGLNLGRPTPDGEPRYVLSIRPVDNTVVVGAARDAARRHRPDGPTGVDVGGAAGAAVGLSRAAARARHDERGARRRRCRGRAGGPPRPAPDRGRRRPGAGHVLRRRGRGLGDDHRRRAGDRHRMTQAPRPWIAGAVTGLGSLPGTDAGDAVALVFGELPELPHLPELPERGPGSQLVGRGASLLTELPVEIVPTGWRLTAHRGRDLRRARDDLARDLDALEQAADGYTGPLKLQVTGPWTLAAGLELPTGHSVLTDHGAVRDLVESLADGVRAHLADVARRVPGADLVLQLDEPSLPTVLAGRVPTASGYGIVRAVEATVAEEILADVLSAAGPGRRVVHCCAPDTPLGLLRAAGADAVSLDATLLGRAHYDALGEAVDAGVSLWLGLFDPLAEPDRGAARERIDTMWRELGFARDQLAASVVATPACGLAGTTPTRVRRLLENLRDLGRSLADEQ